MKYKDIIENLNIESVKKLLKKLGVEDIKETDEYLITNTICHNHNCAGSMKLYFYKQNKMFYCYTECGSMSIFNFLEHYYKTRQINYNWFEDVYNVVLDCSEYQFKEGFEPVNVFDFDKYKKQKNNIELPKYASGVLDIFVKNYPIEWINDGISRRTMDKYNIKYSVSQHKIIIPHYDINNNLVGIRGRALNQWEIENIGKYMPVQIEKKWYKHPLGLNLYGLNFNKGNIKQYGICYIGESEKFVLQMESFTFPNCSCAVCGSQLSKYQLFLLLKNCQPKEIVICFDKEEKKGKQEYFNKLYKMCQKYINYCNISFIYDRENLLNLKDSPTDKGQKIFKKLLEGRVVVK